MDSFPKLLPQSPFRFVCVASPCLQLRDPLSIKEELSVGGAAEGDWGREAWEAGRQARRGRKCQSQTFQLGREAEGAEFGGGEEGALRAIELVGEARDTDARF